MEKTITITLSEDIETALDEEVREKGQTPHEIISEALQHYFFISKFRRLREKMRAQTEHIYTDQDIFDLIS